MILDQLEVRGSAVDVPTATRPLTLLDYPHKPYYWLDPPHLAQDAKKWPTLTTRMKRKDEKLQELLSTPVDIKRRKTSPVEKHRFEVSNCQLPTYRILSDICKSQSKTLEDMKESLFGSYTYDKSPDDLFDLTILYPYMSNAYKKLYSQHINNLREISKNFKGDPKAPKPTDKKRITFQETVESEESADI